MRLDKPMIQSHNVNNIHGYGSSVLGTQRTISVQRTQYTKSLKYSKHHAASEQ